MRDLASVVCCLCLAAMLRAPERARAQDSPLHEYVPAISQSEARATGRGSAELAEDPRAPAAQSGEAEAPAQRGASPNQENFRPDRSTSLEGGLDYYETFNPAIAPFKRVTGFDAVRLDTDGKTPVLGVSDARRRVVALEGTGAAADRRPRDRFSGQVDVSFREQRVQPFPAVSPESRLLSLRTEPNLNVQVERDAADNLFIRALGRVPDEPVRVRWETDAPRTYFGAEVPRLPLRQLPELPRLHPSITRRALRFAGELGVTPRSDLRRALEKLTEHFRNFVESAEPPANTGDLFLDLARGGKGLCRHRAYGFVVTARALGINARFVQNEAHSWVEVELPETGFLRIDLGGATHGLTAHDTRERASYVPSQPDTLPRPAAYRQSYARAARDKAGSAPAEPEELASLSGRWLPDEGAAQTNSAAATAAAGSTAAAKSGEDAADVGRSEVTTPNVKRPVRIALEDRRHLVLRGGKLVLTGRAQDDLGRGVAGLRVELWIQHAQRKQRMLLSVQVTDNDGNFRADFGVPADLAVGDYKLVARSDGDAEHLAASSDAAQ